MRWYGAGSEDRGRMARRPSPEAASRFAARSWNTTRAYRGKKGRRGRALATGRRRTLARAPGHLDGLVALPYCRAERESPNARGRFWRCCRAASLVQRPFHSETAIVPIHVVPPKGEKLTDPEFLAGPADPQGSAGTNGTKWFTGSTVPTAGSPSGAVAGGLYLKTTTCNYHPFGGSSWSETGN